MNVQKWLRELIEDRPMQSTEVQYRAKMAGIRPGELNRAKQELGVKLLKDGPWWWVIRSEQWKRNWNRILKGVASRAE